MGTCSTWRKLLSACFIPFLFLTATRVSLSLRPATVGRCGGGCDMSWRRRNNPRKLKKGWGANPYAKSAKEKRLKSISVSFITRWRSCWEIKAFKRSRLTVGSPTRDSRQHSFQHVFFFFFPSWGDSTLIVFQAAFYLPHCRNHSPSNCVTSQNEGYTVSTLAVFCVSLA